MASTYHRSMEEGLGIASCQLPCCSHAPSPIPGLPQIQGLQRASDPNAVAAVSQPRPVLYQQDAGTHATHLEFHIRQLCLQVGIFVRATSSSHQTR